MPSKTLHLNNNLMKKLIKTEPIKMSPPLTGSNVRAAQQLTRFFSVSK